ncbi:phosphoenolpyruvate--protein phosphotransferase [Gorillibacterium sp. sgz5001074]|uniref:phosphoenolpyruvate--protein phosphotransferase n=1 Tax=Gorillibacterium sp. sgz5001074 TaxID=3446695 RepID=UPI003F664AE3
MTGEWKGVGVSSGIAMGPVRRLLPAGHAADGAAVERDTVVDPDQVPEELERLAAAVTDSGAELAELIEALVQQGRPSEAEIFEGHRMFLQDEEWIGRAEGLIREECRSAAQALTQATDEVAAVLESLDDAYIRERAADIRDVARRIGRKLSGESVENRDCGFGGTGPVILVAEELSPSETAGLKPEEVAGFVTAAGGRNGHSAILARALGIPAVAGAGERLSDLRDGQFLIVDGDTGSLWVDPDADIVERCREKQAQERARVERERQFRSGPTLTADGHRVELAANIGSPQDAAVAAQEGAEGIGLYRTEFLYMGRDTLPTEEEQTEAYRAAVQAFGPGAPVVIRTMDIGGDKEVPLLGLAKEENPFLGYRAIRICLEQTGLFKTQLRAILRASAYGNVKIMFPMVATRREWRRARELLEEAKRELTAEGHPYDAAVETGIMIEVPAAALMADQLAAEVDFFSIGTNDLCQYVMAADRMNPALAELNDPLHPAVLRLVHRVLEAAERHGKWVGMCGEMAGQPHAVPLLLAMGLHEFSMSAKAVARTRRLLSRLDRAALGGLTEEALDCSEADEVRRLVEARVPQILE